MNIKLTIKGQVKGGKNNMIVTRSGLHFPRKEWAQWRDGVVRQIFDQTRTYKGLPMTKPCRVAVLYWREDNRRRDVPGLVDSLWHCLEKADIVKDDRLLESLEWYPQGIDKKTPRVELFIEEK